MFSFFGTNATDAIAALAALNRSQAIIELGIDGTILTANDGFLKVLGYNLDEIKGAAKILLGTLSRDLDLLLTTIAGDPFNVRGQA